VTEGSNLEVELKYLGADHERVREALHAAGARLTGGRGLEVNLVFDNPDERLRRSGRLLRLRDGHELTVKLPVADDRYKSRHELTLQVASGDVEATLAGIDFAVVWRYEKYREKWELGGMLITLDELPFLGQLVEIEGDRDRIDAVAKQLALDALETSTATYRDLFMAHAEKAGIAAGDLTFAAEGAAR
jgi:adenylate cyclase class 2